MTTEQRKGVQLHPMGDMRLIRPVQRLRPEGCGALTMEKMTEALAMEKMAEAV